MQKEKITDGDIKKEKDRDVIKMEVTFVSCCVGVCNCVRFYIISALKHRYLKANGSVYVVTEIDFLLKLI